MAARLHADLDVVFGRLGTEFAEQLTYPGIYRGTPMNVAPVLIERDGETTVVISEADSDACRVMPSGIGKSVYGRYFDWNKDMSLPVRAFDQAVRAVTGDGEIVCDASLPLMRYQDLAKAGPVTLAEKPKPVPLLAYRKARRDIETQWLATRNADAAAFAPFVASLRDGDRLVAAMTATSKGFAPLDALCAEKALTALYVTAPHEVEMFTGMPARALSEQGVTALFTPGDDDILIYSQTPIERSDFRAAGRFEGLSQALQASGLAKIAIQKDHISAGLFETIAGSGFEFADAAYVLRRWQDLRASDDAVYFFFTANAVLRGIEAARAFFKRQAKNGITERDLVAAYHQGVSRFAARFGFKDRVGSYFDIVHSGARTLLPATAGDYPVSADDKTIKFDMGLTVADAFGCVRGVSDIARTICTDPELAALHDRLRAILVDELIPAIRPGMSGADVYAVGVDLLRPLEGELRRLGLLPEGKGVDGYLRDCGHTIQRQTISTVYFLPGVMEVVEQDMLGCTEYVWPIGDVLIAVEDSYIVTSEGTVAFTVDGAR